MEDVVEAANAYFSNSSLTTQMIYSLQLNKEDLNHLSMANGVLSREEGDEVIRFGNMGLTTIDWSSGMILSMLSLGRRRKAV